jgi:predicted amino acid-binding ACT domain protein
MSHPNRFVLTVLLPDRVAALRDVSTVITDLGGFIDGINQTVLAGYFHAILTATFPDGVEAEALRDSILANFGSERVSVVVEPHHGRRASRAAGPGPRYIASAFGVDRLGILKTLTSFLAARGINIEDWQVDFHGANVTHIGEVTLPAHLDIKQVQDEFRSELVAIGLSGGLIHENIFRATHEIGPIRSLLGGSRHD